MTGSEVNHGRTDPARDLSANGHGRGSDHARPRHSVSAERLLKDFDDAVRAMPARERAAIIRWLVRRYAVDLP